MFYKDDYDLAQTYGAKAFEVMGKYKIAPHPHNYETWYAYTGRRNPELTKQIDERISADLAFDPDFSRALYEEYIQQGSEIEATQTAGARLSVEIDRILRLVGSASDNSSELTDSVVAVRDTLTQETSSADVVAAVDAIVNATRIMETRSQELDRRLQETKSEVEELQENLENARSEARTDGLTGIGNRKAFDETLLREMTASMEEGTPMCLLMSDIDHFKKFNDKWGHRTGDQVLRLAAACIRSNIKGRDTPTRYGGEEFAVILPNTRLEDAVILGEQIREAVRSRELVKKTSGETLGRITMSFGLAEFFPGEPLSELIERADACLYAAKHNGRDRLETERSLGAQPAAKDSTA